MIKQLLIYFAKISLKLKIQFLWYPLYYSIYLLYKIAMESRFPVKVTYRNSLAFKALTPPRSDIDVSIFFMENTVDLNQLKLFHERISSLLKIIREISLYEAEYIGKLAHFCNQYEIQKDIGFIHLYGELLPKLHKNKLNAQKIVFLFRTLQSDFKNFNAYPDLKKKKWQYHFEILGHPRAHAVTPQMALTYIIDLIKKDCPNLVNIKQVILFIKSDFTFDESNIHLWFLAPHAYLDYSYQLYNEVRMPVLTLSALEQEIFMAQIEWEIWGLFGQFHLVDTMSLIDKHLKNFLKLSDGSLSPDNAFRVNLMVKDFKAYILQKLMDRIS